MHMSVPPSHTALSGDLHVQVSSKGGGGGPGWRLHVSRVDSGTAHLLYEVPVAPNASSLVVPCGYFSRGGEYYVELVRPTDNDTDTDEDEDKVSRGLDVRWPMPRLSLTPEHVQTYPESPVTAILEFPEVMCPPVVDSAPSAIPEFWLELHYCGHSLLTCDTVSNRSRLQVLYSEQIRGFPGKRMLTLRCELFGLAGHYALVLRPTTPMPSLSNTAAYVKADWSEQFVFNVYARSIMPCDPHGSGIKVLFQYPSCILFSGDRVRVYARRRADVASLVPPTSLEYVAEQRVVRGQHAIHFHCNLFTEHYVEYCFVYVSQAITGAVADVRMDCVPTLPVAESENGGWGAWSPWTACSTTCPGGTRNRYRFCDSPPPKYGSKFCVGSAVETEACSSEDAANSWECMYGVLLPNSLSPVERPELRSEVGAGCRCGCVLHLSEAKTRRLITSSSQSCPGRTFWLIQAETDHVIRLKVAYIRLPCESQWVKVRDGNSLSATLIAHLTGVPSSEPPPVQTTGARLLLEFFSGEVIPGNEVCGGGFVVYAEQLKMHELNISGPVAQGVGVAAAAALPYTAVRLTAVHIAALLFVSLVLVATAMLGAQYLLRYRKYHIAEDMDSLADLGDSSTSVALRARASSSATLLSEVISLTRLRPTPRNKHTRLEESMDCEHETEDCSNDDSGAIKADNSSVGSTTTLTAQDGVQAATSVVVGEAEVSVRSSSGSPAVSEKSGEGSRESASPVETSFTVVPRKRRSSAATLTNGYYSPAASIISTATIRSTNPKESKEKRNRERLLAGPGSEFSLAGQDTDFELDYYDYNVVNAGAVPGSYLGMDPAYLVWIPPLDESGEILQNLDKHPFEYEDIRPKQYVDPGSNQESPEEEVLLPKSRRRSVSEGNPNFQKKMETLRADAKGLTELKSAKELSPLLRHVDTSKCSIPLHEFPKRLGLNSPAKVHRPIEIPAAKENKVEKSPSVHTFLMDDIKFADEEGDDLEVEDSSVDNNQCNKKPYHNSNIITANKS